MLRIWGQYFGNKFTTLEFGKFFFRELMFFKGLHAFLGSIYFGPNPVFAKIIVFFPQVLCIQRGAEPGFE